MFVLLKSSSPIEAPRQLGGVLFWGSLLRRLFSVVDRRFEQEDAEEIWQVEVIT